MRPRGGPQRRQAQLLLLGLLALAAAPRSSSAHDSFDKPKCPAWLHQYEAWHKQHRNQPGAKYLIADAPGFVGVGDHLRGMMYALRAAAATKRVLLLHWASPGNLTDFLEPGSGIDWRFDHTPAWGFNGRTLRTPTDALDVYANNDLGRAYPGATFFSDELSNKTFLVLRTNFPSEQRCLICPPVEGKPAEGYDFVCMFRFLFKPSEEVERTTDEYLRQLYPGRPINLEYQAVHLRLGHMRGEDATINRISGYVDPLAKVLLSVSCGLGLANESGIDPGRTPVLLLADHRGVRQFARHRKLANVVTPAYDAVHTKMNSLRDHLLSFVDLNLLARAKCVVMSHSGFSNVGWWLGGGNNCKMMLGECYRACASDSSGPYCNR